MKTFTQYLSSCTKQQIENIYKILGFTSSTGSKKGQLIADLLDEMTTSPITWLKRLPGTELSSLNHIIKFKDSILVFPYKLIIERLHIVSNVKNKFIISEEFLSISPELIEEALDINVEKNYYELEQYFHGIISAHGIIRLNILRKMLQRIDPKNYQYFMLNNMYFRFFVAKKESDYYVYHPSVLKFNRLFHFWKKAKTLIPIEKKYSKRQYLELGNIMPYVHLDINSYFVSQIRNICMKAGLDDSFFQYLYHDMFMALNEGSLFDFFMIAGGATRKEKNEEMSNKYLKKIISLSNHIPLWILRGHSLVELGENGLFDKRIDALLEHFWDRNKELFSILDKISAEKGKILKFNKNNFDC